MAHTITFWGRCLNRRKMHNLSCELSFIQGTYEDCSLEDSLSAPRNYSHEEREEPRYKGVLVQKKTHVVEHQSESRSVVSDSETPWTVALQAPLSVGFSRQGYWSRGCPSLIQGIFLTQGLNPGLLRCRQSQNNQKIIANHKSRHPKLMILVLLYVWEDAKIWETILICILTV